MFESDDAPQEGGEPYPTLPVPDDHPVSSASVPAGRTVSAGDVDLSKSRTVEEEYRDNAAAATKLKHEAKKFIADAIKSGDYELPMTAEEKDEMIAEREKAREYEVKHAPKKVEPVAQTKPGGPQRRHIAHNAVSIPNYVKALDYSCSPQNQNYALVSYLGPRNCRPIGDEWAFRLWGVFATQTEATEYVEYIRATNRYSKFYDILLLDINGGWSPFPPVLDAIEQQKFQDEHVQDFHDGHLEQQKKAQKHHEERLSEADDINPDIARARKIKEEGAKLSAILEKRAAATGKTTEQLLAEHREDIFEELRHSKTTEEAPRGAGQRVVYEERKNDDGTVDIVKKTITRRRKGKGRGGKSKKTGRK